MFQIIITITNNDNTSASTSVTCNDNYNYHINYHDVLFSFMYLSLFCLLVVRMFGCLCDEGYAGYDCSLHQCPEGEK